MGTRKPLDGQAMGLMLLLSMIWGMQQVAVKAAAPDIDPILQIALRSGLAACLVWLVIIWRGQKLDYKSSWRPGLLAGLLFGVEFVLIGEGLRYTSASHMVVFLYSAPIFVALALHFKMPTERLSGLQWGGVLLAFFGIAFTFFGGDQASTKEVASDVVLGDFLGLLAGLIWGATTVVIRTSCLATLPATQTLLYQLGVSFFILLLASVALGQTAFSHSVIGWGSLLFQSLIVAFASFLVWFWLLRQYLASQLGVFSFMTPLFGVGFGVWLLDEPLDTSFMTGSGLVLLGVLMVSAHAKIIQITLAGWSRLNSRQAEVKVPSEQKM